MVFLLLVVFGFSTKPLTMIRLFAELSGHYLGDQLPHPLTDGFAKDATKQTQWTAFLRRNGLTGAPLDFEDVIEAIREFVVPALRKDGTAIWWKPGKGWRGGPES
jgi:hypothetical protein